MVLALGATTARAADESPFKFEFHGFVVGSLYNQDQAFANAQGQGLLLAAPTPANKAKGAAVPDNPRLFGGDVRESRFAFSLTGPKEAFLGATPRAYFEFDLFGLNGTGAFSSEQQVARLRAAYAEAKWSNATLQVGQQNQLLVVQTPTTVAHVPNPVTYGAGTLGWRTTGARVLYAIPLEGMKLELGVEVVKNNWNNGNQSVSAQVNCGAPTTPPAAPGCPDPRTTGGASNSPATISLAEANGLPQVQGRVKLDGKAGDLSYMAYLVGAWHQVALEGFGGSVTAPTIDGTKKRTLTGYAVQAGGKVNFAPVTLMVNAYTGQGTSNWLGSIVQFGEMADKGGWAQLGVDATKELSIWGLYGLGRPSASDVRKWVATNGRLENDVYGALVRYQEGGYAVGLEWYQFSTKYSTGASTDQSVKAQQIIASAGYFF
jgi:hypothetical protein